jgi:hypothetical protein
MYDPMPKPAPIDVKDLIVAKLSGKSADGQGEIVALRNPSDDDRLALEVSHKDWGDETLVFIVDVEQISWAEHE